MIYLLALIGFLIPLLIVSNFCEIFNLSTTWKYKWLKYTLIAIALLIILSTSTVSFELIGQYSLYIFIFLAIINIIKKAIAKVKSQNSIIKLDEIEEYSSEVLEVALNSDKYTNDEINIIKAELKARKGEK